MIEDKKLSELKKETNKEIEQFEIFVNNASTIYLIYDENLHTGRLKSAVAYINIVESNDKIILRHEITRLIDSIHDLKPKLYQYVNLKNGGVNVSGLRADENYTMLKTKYRDLITNLKLI